MATIGSGSPLLYVEGSAVQTGGSGNQRTIKITAKFKVNGSSASWYAYPCNWRARVHNSYGGWAAIKGNESWNGGQALRTFEQTLTVDVGTTSSTNITVGIYTDSSGGWNGNYTWTFTVGATNRAPGVPGAFTIRNGSAATSPVIATGTNNATVSENISNLYISWGAASDPDGDALNYSLNESKNGSTSYSQVDYGSDLAHSYAPSGWGEGGSLKFYVDAKDSKGAWGGKTYSGTVTKNRFTMDTLASSGSIGYLSANGNLTFTFSGGANTQSGVTITRKLTCDNGITVYNAASVSSPLNLAIYVSGTLPTGPYIKFADIKTKFGTSALKGKGTLTFTLTGTNSNGTVKTSTKAIAVNIQTTPNAVTSQQISLTQSESTNYLTVASTSNKYFIPDGTKVTRVKWNAASGKFNDPVKYEVYVAYGSGGWNYLATTTSTYYNHAVPRQTASQQFKYLVRTISTWNEDLYTDVQTSAQTLHYYNQPGLTRGTITRAATTADVIVTIKTNTSIPNVNTKGTWNCYNSGTTTGAVSTGSLTAAQTAQTIKVISLTDAGTYDLIVSYNDDTGFMTSNKTETIGISANLPILFINKYGIGVNGVQATSSRALDVKGTANATNLTVGGNNVYHTGRKPTAADVGAVPTSRTVNGKALSANISITKSDVGLGSVNNWGASSTISANSTSQYATTNMVAQVRAEKANLNSPVFPTSITISEAGKQLLMGCGTGDVYIKNSKTDTYLQFSDDNTLKISGDTIGDKRYPVIDRNNSRWFGKIAPVMSDGVMEIGRYIDFHKDNVSTADYTVRLEANGSQLWCSTTIAQASDKNLKENIVYLDDMPMLLRAGNNTPFSDFIRDFKFATFNYKGSDERSFGFIAQDIANTPVGDLMLSEVEQDVINKETNEIEGTQTSLSFGIADYTSVVARALQETIKEKDAEITELKNEIAIIKKHLGI